MRMRETPPPQAVNARRGTGRRVLAGLALLAGLAAPAGPAQAEGGKPEQRVHRTGFIPAGDDVFAVLTQFYDLDESLPLDARTVEAWDEGGARHEKVVFTTGNGERVPGEIALPSSGKQPLPSVLLLHGLGSSRERWWREDRRDLRRILLARGIAVFAIDLRYHGERAALNDYQNPVYLTLGNTLFVRNRDMIVQSAIDARRALAYLATRGELDGGRMGVAGYSMGGMIALYLAALEERVTAVVACAVPTTGQPAPVDHFHFAPRAGAPVLLMMGRKDWLSSPEDAGLLLRLLPAEGSDLRFHDSGHSLPPAFAADAAEWLGARLQ